ncbi:NADH:flavin oxidoreductase/NADH oxidase family protein-like protein [Xylaria grammica]|nr:NADH:flavin oxidoreductase/NADH oxidase family protein-like protein [Xylaria grammica]
MPETRLFKPLRIGDVEVKHRIAMAPLTRLRGTNQFMPTPLMKEYYSQRASIPGTLIISEGTYVSPSAVGSFTNTPGIWSEEQIAAWKIITDEVHRKGSFIFCQICGMGRAAKTEEAKRRGIEIVGPSPIPIDQDSPVPRPMTIEEIKKSVQEFATASENAVKAGFDGVEIHGANGYLVDQFIQDVSNQRDDAYGGSVENRSRYVDEIMKAAVNAIGAGRVGLRLSPWSSFQAMKMEDPIPQFSDVIIKAAQLNLAYLHLVESRINGSDDVESSERLDFAYKLWDGPILVAGGYKSADAQRLVDEEYPEKDIVVVFGRLFVSNPDLVYRIKEGLELSAHERGTLYTIGSPVGYVDYPFSAKYLASQSA